MVLCPEEHSILTRGEAAYFDEKVVTDYLTEIQAHKPSNKNSKNDKIVSELWLSKQFPLSFDHFRQVLDALSLGGNAQMNKIIEFLDNQCLKDVISENGFPVKIQIPIGIIIKATVTFTNFKFLSAQFINKDLFTIPDEFKQVSRKEGMKVMESKKKRLVVANVIS